MVSHSSYIESSLHGRYISLKHLDADWLLKHAAYTSVIGQSVLGKDIPALTLGKGSIKILMWSQMHGNESTTTKAVADLVNYLTGLDQKATVILEKCTLKIVPILNPDGAEAYTRSNANDIDLNRDAKMKSQPESLVLRKLFDSFQPNYCFNLHDQRTLFSAGAHPRPATVSFLSPSMDAERTVTHSREIAMKVIVAMNEVLQNMIPSQVGRYDDSFNENCVGDSFQMEGVPTILFEAGHFQKDYSREETRKYIFYALLKALQAISDDDIDTFKTEDYWDIPENKKLFYDIIINNVHLINPNFDSKTSVGIRYQEFLSKNQIQFLPQITNKGDLKTYFGHQIYDCAIEQDFNAISKEESIYEIISTQK